MFNLVSLAYEKLILNVKGVLDLLPGKLFFFHLRLKLLH